MKASYWQAIVDNDYQVPVERPLAELVDELMELLASSNIQERDPYGYMTLAHWLVRRQIPVPLMTVMLNRCLNDMFVKIGEQNTDSIFRRSFAVVVAFQILNEDNKNPFLDEGMVCAILDHTLRYTLEERDLRGWVDGKGFAHSMGHIPLLMMALADNRHIRTDELRRLLAQTADKFLVKGHPVYLHGEPERFGRMILTTARRDLVPLDDWEHWVKRLTGFVDGVKPYSKFDPEFHATYTNIKNLLRCAFIELEQTDTGPTLSYAIRRLIKKSLRVFSE